MDLAITKDEYQNLRIQIRSRMEGVRDTIALIAKVRDTEAWKYEFTNFDDFLEDVCDIPKTTGLRLLEAHDVRERLAEIHLSKNMNTSQLLALKDCADDDLEGVILEVEAMEKVTAKSIKEAIERQRSNLDGEGDEDADDDQQDDSEEYEDVDDEPDQPTNAGLEAIKNADVFKSLADKTTQLLKDWNAAKELPGAEFLRNQDNHIVSDLRGVGHLFRKYRPIQICQFCEGAGCQQCGNMGYETKHIQDERKVAQRVNSN